MAHLPHKNGGSVGFLPFSIANPLNAFSEESLFYLGKKGNQLLKSALVRDMLVPRTITLTISIGIHENGISSCNILLEALLFLVTMGFKNLKSLFSSSLTP